jgi:hypothetical protein
MTRTKVRQQAKPTVPVNMKKVNEATSMYPMYSITDTPRVITIFVVIYTTAAVWSARGGRLARGAGRGRRAEGAPEYAKR